QRVAQEALAGPLETYHAFFLSGRRFIGGDHPSIADIRLAATLEFLRAIDYPMPSWMEEYMAAMEDALGDAYTEPAGDVRGYIAYVKSQQPACPGAATYQRAAARLLQEGCGARCVGNGSHLPYLRALQGVPSSHGAARIRPPPQDPPVRGHPGNRPRRHGR